MKQAPTRFPRTAQRVWQGEVNRLFGANRAQAVHVAMALIKRWSVFDTTLNGIAEEATRCGAIDQVAAQPRPCTAFDVIFWLRQFEQAGVPWIDVAPTAAEMRKLTAWRRSEVLASADVE